jgi:signal transduction histidine kinase/CheY-like chemotaxis protein
MIDPTPSWPSTARTPLRRRWILPAAGLVLVALVSLLLLLNHRASRTLRANLLEQLAQRNQVHAAALGHLLDSALKDVRTVAASAEVATYYESRDLGMSLQYGLGLALLPIRGRLQELTVTTALEPSPLFSRALLLDAGGAVLADSQGPGAPPWRGPLDPAITEGSVVLADEGHALAVVLAHRWKGRPAGWLVAWLRPEGVAGALLGAAGGEAGQVGFALLQGGARWRPEPAIDAGLAVPAEAEALPADGRTVREVGADLLAVRAPVPGQPLTLVLVRPASALLVPESTGAVALGLALAAAATLALVWLSLSSHTTALVLEARLDETVRRGREVAEKHAALERETAERRRLEERLRHAQRLEAIGTLAGGVAHDFNNLLTAVKGYASAALEELRTWDPARADVEEIKRAADRGAELVRQLLAFSRKQVLKPRVLDLDEAVAGVEKLLRRLAGEQRTLEVVRGGGAWRVRVDPGQLEQVLVNLVVNARDATAPGGRITIASDEVALDEAAARRWHDGLPGRFVRLSVSDDGAGIDEATLVHIFEPFFTTKERGRGTGLGLSTVYGIVNQSHGFIAVTSAPGQGTRFDVFLPAEPEGTAAAGVAAAPAPPRPPAARPGETILVAEDDEQVRSLLRTHLAAGGYAVLDAGDGAEALELLGRHPGPVDLLLTDLVMPRLGGRELAARFKERFPRAPVVYMSGYAEEAVAAEGDLGIASAFVQKPFEVGDLDATLRRLLEARAAATPAA